MKSKNKKIALLAVRTFNYGSLLQTYALQHFLNIQGFDNEIIIYKKTNYFKQALRLFYYPLFKQTFDKLIKSIYARFYSKEISEILKARRRCFENFLRYLNFSEPYIGRNQLVNGVENYFCFILGSDQVWNPMNYGADFFSMSFVPDEIKKIAYAPSFGVTKIPSYQIKKTIAFLKRIDCLSAREVSGQSLIKQLTGRDSVLVADPTILISREKWDELRGNRLIQEPYIMCYFLGSNHNHREYALRLQHKTGRKIVTLPYLDQIVKSDINFGDIIPTNIGPIEFINLISYADYVCTDSFHGTVFSLLYERNFVTFNRYINSSTDSTNSRLSSLLNICGMQDRLVDSSKELVKDLQIERYEEVRRKINVLRKISNEFIIDSLSSM